MNFTDTPADKQQHRKHLERVGTRLEKIVPRLDQYDPEVARLIRLTVMAPLAKILRGEIPMEKALTAEVKGVLKAAGQTTRRVPVRLLDALAPPKWTLDVQGRNISCYDKARGTYVEDLGQRLGDLNYLINRGPRERGPLVAQFGEPGTSETA